MTIYRKTVSALGTAYHFTYPSNDGDGKRFTATCQILFQSYGTPKLVFGDSLVPIDEPERFGKWQTPTQRKQFCEAFAKPAARI